MLFGKRKQSVSLEELRRRAAGGIATQKGDAEMLAALKSNGKNTDSVADASVRPGLDGGKDAAATDKTVADLSTVRDDTHAALDLALGRHSGVTKTLVARDLVKTYRGRNVVNHVNITLRTGEIVGLLGPNGAGKTTSFYMIIGLVTPNGGQILLDGEDITRLPIYKRARRGIGYLSQESSVFKKLTVAENILLVWEATGVPESRQREMLGPLLREFKIDHIADYKAYVLSGGERRRTEVARCLAGNPDFIMLDEPFTGIDPVTIESLKDVIASLRDKGLGVLITDHNVRETLNICDRAYIVMDGEVLVEGTPQEVASNAMARKYFLGEQFRLD
jgi:lipopolysaccharide export system ATP-binding protein